MKIKNILLAGLALTAMSSCNDYLDVETPSQYSNEYIYSKASEIDFALNGVYAQLMSANGFGNNFLANLQLNSDVDFTTNANSDDLSSAPKRFLAHTDDSNVEKAWNQCYTGIEYANNFIYGLENSPLYKPTEKGYSDLQQMLGEAKVIRAMFYYELVWYWGDVPFIFNRTLDSGVGAQPIMDRTEILDKVIADLKDIAPYMKPASETTIERISQEAAWAMIARLALTAGGYSLHPDKNDPTSHGTMTRPANYQDYYKVAMEYADSVILSGSHSLTKSYRQVFIDECKYLSSNASDDVIFEIPFAQKNSGNIGYIQGPRCDFVNGSTTHLWGRSSGSAALSAFYRFSFDEKDLRRDFLNLKWYYVAAGTPTPSASYTVYNGKWSKFWNMAPVLDNTSEGNTGINYPYLRYTDVLLMFAEAVNEYENGVSGDHGDAAKKALETVRKRAFASDDWQEKATNYVNNASSKEAFLKAVLNERKWEFAGENMRWRDLVRNNMYAEAVYYSFLRYYSVGQEAAGSGEFVDAIEAHDLADGYRESYITNLPGEMYFNVVDNPNNVDVYPNTSLQVMEVKNWMDRFDADKKPTNDWQTVESWVWASADGWIRGECLYSFRGFIYNDGRSDGTLNTYIIDNHGNQQEVQTLLTADQLPVVRYILPIPRTTIQRSGGAYQNYYGY